MDSKITYHQQVSYCGKPRCRRCREGTGHGPYWYAYQTVNGRTVRTYVGKELPPELQAQATGVAEESIDARAPEAASAVVRLYVLGQFTLERHNGQRWQAVTDATMQHQRVRSLLTCLISSPGRKLGREQVLELLWPDLDFDTASHRLDKAVHSLRQLFEPGRTRPATTSLLLTEHSTIMLADQSQVWVDADAFESLLARARTTGDPGQAEQLLEEAMLLYAGDYLPEERHVEWTQTRRESLQRGWIGLLLELADHRIAREAISSAIDTLDRLLAIDPTNEAAVQRLILLLAQAGRRAEAMRIYQRFAALLKQEYKMAPLQETRALYEAAQRGNSAALTLAAGPKLPATSHTHDGQSLEPEARPAMQVGRSNQSRLVGRDAELAALKQILVDTEQARRMKLAGQKKSVTSPALESGRRVQCVLLMGDVGIGKTRLAEEMGREASRRGWTVTWTRAYIQETSIPYRMWTETLRKAMTRGLWQRQEIARRPLIYQALRALLPELEDLLPPPDPSAVSPEQEQLRLWEAARALLATISESAPLMIVLDDLQWADSSSCELMAYLVRQLRQQPVVIVGTCRDIELPPNHPLRSVLNDLQREQSIETLTVQPLTDEQIRALIAPLPEVVARHIQQRAAGNPFFAEELARNVSDMPLPVSNTSASLDVPATMPDTIAAVLDLRLGRISSDCQRLLVRAAVLGGSFEFSALRALESGPTASDEDTLLDLLEEALQAGMLSEEGSGTRITYHFWHPLLVSHLYDGLSAGLRASLHRRAADALVRLYSDRAESAAAIAYHLVNGGSEPSSIAHYAELAGDRAYALSAYPEAVRHYKLALDNIGTLAASASADEHLRLANLLERLGECTRAPGNNEEARGYFERSLETRKQYQQNASKLDVPYEAQIDALLWIEVGKTWYDLGNFEQAEQSFDRAEQILCDANVGTGPVWASLGLERSYILWRKGNFEQARETAHHTLNIFEDILRQQEHITADLYHSTATIRTLAGDPVDVGRTHLLIAAIAATVGESTDALHHQNTALTIFEQHDRQREIALVCGNIGDAYLRKAEHQLAQSALRRSLSIAERIGHLSIMSVAFGNLGMLLTRLGDLREAEIYYKRALELAEQIHDPVYTSLWSGYLAIPLQDQGKLDEAKLSIQKSLTIGRNKRIPFCTGFALVTLGHLRINQAISEQWDDHHASKTVKPQRLSPTWLLQHARVSLLRGLAIGGLEAETRTEGLLGLAQASFLLREIDIAQQQANHALEEAKRYEQTWLLVCIQRLLGTILAVQGWYEEAKTNFVQSIETLKERRMRLEYARTLRDYGEAILKHAHSNDNDCKQAIAHLQEAREIFHGCSAVLDLDLVNRVLATYTKPVEAAARKRDR